ncbi:MAG: DUF4199 domain-containing protein [Mucilaginibacter sp.]|jgi:hypothetical protein
MELKPNPTKVATKWALIYLVTGIVLTYIMQFSNMDPTSPVRYVSYLPFIIFLLLAQKEFKDQLGGYMKFGEGFSVGLRFGVFAGILFGIFLYIYLGILSPEVLAKSVDSQRDAMAAKGLSSDQIDKGIQMSKKYGAIFAAFGVAIWYAILGVILGLIGAAIFKKERSALDTPEEVAGPTV